MHKVLAAVIVLVALTIGAGAQEEKRGPSTPEERARAVRIAQALEAQPTDQSLHDDSTWLLRWVVEVPDLSVSICSANMPWKDKYKHSGDLAAVGLAATVAFVIQHPDEGKDAARAGLAAMEINYSGVSEDCPAGPKRSLQRDGRGSRDSGSGQIGRICSRPLGEDL